MNGWSGWLCLTRSVKEANLVGRRNRAGEPAAGAVADPGCYTVHAGQICDGYDINSIGPAVPQLTHAWNLPSPAFTTAFLWSSTGIPVGTLSSGPIGDHIGRKSLLLASLMIFGLASVLAVVAGLAGLGIGGVMPGSAT
jgi:MFS family permease